MNFDDLFRDLTGVTQRAVRAYRRRRPEGCITASTARQGPARSARARGHVPLAAAR
jgi:hypothetical protein